MCKLDEYLIREELRELTETPQSWEEEVKEVLEIVDKKEGQPMSRRQMKMNLLIFKQRLIQAMRTQEKESELNVYNRG